MPKYFEDVEKWKEQKAREKAEEDRRQRLARQQERVKREAKHQELISRIDSAIRDVAKDFAEANRKSEVRVEGPTLGKGRERHGYHEWIPHSVIRWSITDRAERGEIRGT